MKLYFCSFMFQNAEEDIRKSKHPNPISGHKFSENLIRGFVANGVDTTVINISRARRYPDYPKIIFRKKSFSFDGTTPGIHLGYINLPGLNILTQTRSSYRCLKKLLKNRDKSQQNILMTFNTTLPHAMAMLKIKKKYPDVILCTSIGDIHGKFGIKALKSRIKTGLDEKLDDLARQFDCYAFVSKYMADALGVSEKPCTVLEGMYVEQEAPPQETPQEKTLFYAGALMEEYGIPHLLQSFSLIQDPEYRLLIAGQGSAVPLIQQYCEKDSRITYLGVITPQQVARYQQQATALLSPRIAGNYEFVKYSFPSKTMECLASGKPYIAHQLACDPPEYAHHIQYATDESDQALCHKMQEICELPAAARAEIGSKARAFILNEKNPKAMTGRIIALWKEMEK